MAAYSAVDIFMRLNKLDTLYWLDTSVSPSVWRPSFSRGVTIPAFAGQATIEYGQVVYVSNDYENVRLAKNTVPETQSKIVGLSRQPLARQGQPLAVQMSGLFDFAFPNPAGTALYVDGNGFLTATMPTSGYIQQIAVVWSATQILILMPSGGGGGGGGGLIATAGEAITNGQIIFLSGAATVSVASCDIPAAVTNVIGFAGNTGALGDTIYIRETGLVTLSSIPGVPPDDLFLHLNGGLTNDPDTIPVGNFVQRVGLKWSNSQVKIAISESIYNKD